MLDLVTIKEVLLVVLVGISIFFLFGLVFSLAVLPKGKKSKIMFVWIFILLILGASIYFFYMNPDKFVEVFRL